MAKPKQPTNPFYALLLAAGVLFSVTACAYCVMAFRAVLSRQAGEASTSGQQLMQFIDQYGLWLMLGEIVLLAIATVGAITTDSYWTKADTATKADSTPSH